jgi:hypothetical protein
MGGGGAVASYLFYMNMNLTLTQPSYNQVTVPVVEKVATSRLRFHSYDSSPCPLLHFLYRLCFFLIIFNWSRRPCAEALADSSGDAAGNGTAQESDASASDGADTNGAAGTHAGVTTGICIVAAIIILFGGF